MFHISSFFILSSFQNQKKGKRETGYPRFQGRNRYDSFTYLQSGFSLERKRLKLSKISNVRIKLHRQVDGEIKTCTH